MKGSITTYGVDKSFLRKISNPENGLCDMVCWSHDREGCPLQEEGTVADMWK